MGILKFLGKCLGAVLGVFLIIWDILEFIALPAILVVIGMICQMPPAFYWIVILGYLAIFAALQLILWILEKTLGKRFDAFVVHKLEKWLNKE